MSDVRVHVDRPRPTCPFCKEAVAGGHVWVCPGCEASHHAACHDEHGDCASCALAEPRVLATKGDERGALAPRRRELERLGFTIVREGPDELVAMHSSWLHRPLLIPMPHTVIVKRVPHLSLATLEADLAALKTNPLASMVTVTVYLADLVDPGATHFVESGRGQRGLFDRVRAFPVIRDASTGAGTFLTGTPARLPLGVLTLPGARHLARRLLSPWLEPAPTQEPLTARPARLVAFVVISLALTMIIALVIASLPL